MLDDDDDDNNHFSVKNTINPTATTFSSTLMWVKYVLEQMPCAGSDGPQMHLPDWFPTQETVTGDDDDKVRRAVAIVLAVVVVLFVAFVAAAVAD